MTARYLNHTPSTRENLDYAIRVSPDHVRPILTAVRDCGVGMLFVMQTPQAFRLPRDGRPQIILIGDDTHRADGPAGFHMPSIRRAIRACSAFAVVSSAPPTLVYAEATVPVILAGQNAMIVETRPEQEIQWVSLIQKLAPGRFIRLATVEGGRA